jgi:hypothetical protein
LVYCLPKGPELAPGGGQVGRAGEPDRITWLGFMLSDKKPGTFQMQVERAKAAA